MSKEFDRILAMEDEARLLRRDLEEEQSERRALAERLKLAEERLHQAEEDVKDAHDRAKNAEDRIAVLEDWLERFEPEKHDEVDDVDERELGEAGA